MEKQSLPKKGWVLPPDQLSRLSDYFLLLIDIDQKNKQKNLQIKDKGTTNEVLGFFSNVQ